MENKLLMILEYWTACWMSAEFLKIPDKDCAVGKLKNGAKLNMRLKIVIVVCLYASCDKSLSKSRI